MMMNFKKKSELDVYGYYMELGALLFLLIAVVCVYSISNTYLKFINVFVSGLICGYILFRKKFSFRTMFITLAWIVGLMLGIADDFLLIAVLFILGAILTYQGFKNKWFDI